MEIAVLSQSKLLAATDIELMTLACAQQMQQHIAPAWNRLPIAINYYGLEALCPPGALKLVFFDDADSPGALGYHTEANDVIYGRVFAKPVLDSGGVPLYDPTNPQNTSVASVLSHEASELFCDPYVNYWTDGPAIAQGSEYSLEIADPVENDSYVMPVMSQGKQIMVSVSNFILPAWFDTQATSGKFDFLGKLKAPFTMSAGGYMVVRSNPGAAQQVFAEHYPAWRKDYRTLKLGTVSRMARRAAHVKS